MIQVNVDAIQLTPYAPRLYTLIYIYDIESAAEGGARQCYLVIIQPIVHWYINKGT